ncbi:hypothetical protein PS1_042948 [Malus domestica]
MAVGMHKILVIGIGILVSCLLLQCEQVDAKEYIVGDEKRWSPDLTQWTEGKKFKAGDVLGKITEIWFS